MTASIDQLTQLAGYTDNLNEQETPLAMLDGLDEFVSTLGPMRALCVARLSRRFGDWDDIELGHSVFLHSSAPEGWWQEYRARGSEYGFEPSTMLARSSFAPYTWTEAMRQLQPKGADRWPVELALKYGMRDGLTCPLAGRWIVVFWSKAVISEKLSQQSRTLISIAANFTAQRVAELVAVAEHNEDAAPALTPREVSVLRLASLGHKTREIAKALEIGEETARSHIKRAQRKLGTTDRVHTVAEAMRRDWIL